MVKKLIPSPRTTPKMSAFYGNDNNLLWKYSFLPCKNVIKRKIEWFAVICLLYFTPLGHNILIFFWKDRNVSIPLVTLRLKWQTIEVQEENGNTSFSYSDNTREPMSKQGTIGSQSICESRVGLRNSMWSSARISNVFKRVIQPMRILFAKYVRN